jgi:Flp pilus assembly pilin Flp
VPKSVEMKNVFLTQARSWALLLSRCSAERGQTMAEYGILIGVIAIIIVVAAVFLGGSIANLFRGAGSHL